MGRRGPKPEPAAVKEAKGNSARRPIGKDPKVSGTVAKASDVKPPAWLKGDGLKFWKDMAPRLAAQKLLTATDVWTFARYCINFARWLEANRFLDAQKTTDGTSVHYDTDTGYERIRAAMAVSMRLEPLLERAEDRFGLNPAERQRIFAARAASPNPDLFNPAGGQRPDRQPPNQPTPDQRSPVGLLN